MKGGRAGGRTGRTASVPSPLALLLGALAACVPAGPEVPGPAGATPLIRVALITSADRVQLGGGEPLIVLDGEGRPLLSVARGATLDATRLPGGGIALQAGATTIDGGMVLEVVPEDSGAAMTLLGRQWRGTARLSLGAAGLQLVNVVAIEDYLAGVVNAEMGRRAPEEMAALRAQAIASRTYALTAVLRGRARPWDVVASVSDQAYAGMAGEADQGRVAVLETRGQILTWAGQPIEAFYHSTCAGRTTPGDEVFVNGNLPYLVAVADTRPDGEAWCAISPRYRWQERWTAVALARILRGTLAAEKISVDPDAPLADVAVRERSASGRVRVLAIRFAQAEVTVEGAAVRRVLRQPTGDLLRSAAFDLHADRENGRLIGLTAAGRGAGHGVGMCQWGAIGRARAGHSVADILSAYFPGTVIERRW